VAFHDTNFPYLALNANETQKFANVHATGGAVTFEATLKPATGTAPSWGVMS
jgi:hypothetical protein